MTHGEVAIAVAVAAGGTLMASGFGGLAWLGRRLVGKVYSMDKAVSGDGNGKPGLGERLRDVHAEVQHVRREFRDHANDPRAHRRDRSV